MTKPIAQQYERDVFRAGKALDKNGKRVEDHVGRETIREGECPDHQRRSTDFRGVNTHGWIFRCSDGPHYFTNSAPR